MTTSLCFDGLQGDKSHRYLIISPDQDENVALALAAEVDILITIRHLYEYPPIWQRAITTGVPQYYFTDDNFPLLQTIDPTYNPYKMIAHRNNLRLFKGVLSSSANLISFYRENKLHDNVQFFGVVRDPNRAPLSLSTRNGQALHIGCFGGGFRSAAVKTAVLPALKKLAESLPVKFFARDDLEPLRREFEDAGIQFITTRVVDDVHSFYATWRDYDLDITVHPSGASVNLPYKTANALLISHYLGANPIVTDEPAYNGTSEADGVTIVDGSSEGYLAAFERFTSSRYRHDMFARLEVYTKSAFDNAKNLATLDRIQQELGIENKLA